MKLTKRKGFNFFRSYYDVYNELTDKDKVAFIDALLDRQFLGVKPVNLNGMAKFAYISQTNSIDNQVKGYNDKMKKLGNPLIGEDLPPTYGGQTAPTEQVQEKEEEKEEEKEKEQGKEKQIRFSFRKSLCELGLNKNLVDDFLKNRKTKRLANTETAFKNLVIEFNKTDFEINELMNKIVSSGWGSFKNSWLEKEKNVSQKKEKINAGEIIKRVRNGVN